MTTYDPYPAGPQGEIEFRDDLSSAVAQLTYLREQVAVLVDGHLERWHDTPVEDLGHLGYAIEKAGNAARAAASLQRDLQLIDGRRDAARAVSL
jgi:hypothetical protein